MSVGLTPANPGRQYRMRRPFVFACVTRINDGQLIAVRMQRVNAQASVNDFEQKMFAPR
jgi:hypothetical protein